MHRGSSKGTTEDTDVPETLPLSASSPVRHRVTLEILRGGRSVVVERSVPEGTLLRELLRQSGQSPEGCAVLLNEIPIPLDTPVRDSAHFIVLPTFSGG